MKRFTLLLTVLLLLGLSLTTSTSLAQTKTDDSGGTRVKNRHIGNLSILLSTQAPKKTWTMNKDSSWAAYSTDSSKITIRRQQNDVVVVEAYGSFRRTTYYGTRFIISGEYVVAWLFERPFMRKGKDWSHKVQIVDFGYDLDKIAPFLNTFCEEWPINKMVPPIKTLLKHRTPVEPLIILPH